MDMNFRGDTVQLFRFILLILEWGEEVKMKVEPSTMSKSKVLCE